jgi:hypothetical protein
MAQAKPEAKHVAGVIMALQAPLQGRKPGPRFVLIQEAVQRDLELQDTAQSLPEIKRRQVEKLLPAQQVSLSKWQSSELEHSFLHTGTRGLDRWGWQFQN